MSGRGFTPEVIAELGNATTRPIHLLEVDFNPTIYMTDAGIEITWNGNVYLPSQFLGFSEISETSDLLVNSCTVSLSGVDQSIPALLLQETYLNRRLRIRKAFLTEALAVISSPVLAFDGRMDKPTINVDPDGGTIVCSVECVSHWTDFQRLAGRHTNDAEERKFFPEDNGFDQVATIPNDIFWGIPHKLARTGVTNYNLTARRSG